MSIRTPVPNYNYQQIMENIDNYNYEIPIKVSDEFYPTQASLHDMCPDRMSIANDLQLSSEDQADKFMLEQFCGEKSNEYKSLFSNIKQTEELILKAKKAEEEVNKIYIAYEIKNLVSTKGHMDIYLNARYKAKETKKKAVKAINNLISNINDEKKKMKANLGCFQMK